MEEKKEMVVMSDVARVDLVEQLKNPMGQSPKPSAIGTVCRGNGILIPIPE